MTSIKIGSRVLHCDTNGTQRYAVVTGLGMYCRRCDGNTKLPENATIDFPLADDLMVDVDIDGIGKRWGWGPQISPMPEAGAAE